MRAVFRRDGRVAEGAPLLRVYRFTPIEGSNPSLSATSFYGSRFLVFPSSQALAQVRLKLRRGLFKGAGTFLSLKNSLQQTGDGNVPFPFFLPLGQALFSLCAGVFLRQLFRAPFLICTFLGSAILCRG